MNIFNLQISDNFIREYEKHCIGSADISDYEKIVRNIIHVEMGMDVETAIQMYDKEKIEQTIVSVMKEEISNLWIDDNATN